MLLHDVSEIFLPKNLFWQTVAHARRKLDRTYLPDEEPEPKAYGLMGGKLVNASAEVTHVFPLKRNLRYEPHIKAHVDQLMEEVAIPSETPLEKRGWVADPEEVMHVEQECDRAGSVLLGGYHMHRVAWEHDPVRDTCTAIDSRLADGSALWVFILSMVDPDNPVLRAFFEGHNDKEAPVRLGHYPMT